MTYCAKFRKKIENLDSNILKQKNDRKIMLSKRAVCRIKKSRFEKQQEANGLLSSLGLKTSLHKIPLLGDILF